MMNFITPCQVSQSIKTQITDCLPETVSWTISDDNDSNHQREKKDQLRECKELTLTSPLDNNQTLVPLHSHDKHPEYLIYAGIVFTVLSRFYLYEFSRREWHRKAPTNLINLALHSRLQEQNQQIVIINQILVDDINHGISSDFANSVLKTVNGVEIQNIKHLAELIDNI
ncbi:unnamed protein product [Rotaria sp. Silwood1]|nr:unnamed protein product [Rotaria sp. Silwood1]